MNTTSLKRLKSKRQSSAKALHKDYMESLSVASYIVEHPDCLVPASPEEKQALFTHLERLRHEGKCI